MEKVFDNDLVEIEDEEQKKSSGTYAEDLSQEENAEILRGSSSYEVGPIEKKEKVLLDQVMDLVAKNFKASTGREADATYLAEMHQIYGDQNEARLRDAAARLARQLEKTQHQNALKGK